MPCGEALSVRNRGSRRKEEREGWTVRSPIVTDDQRVRRQLLSQSAGHRFGLLLRDELPDEHPIARPREQLDRRDPNVGVNPLQRA